MEKRCEFCGTPQAVVYCQADAALLCLSCDSKVHSANALFSRHSRTLLCDSCKQIPAYFRCLDHFMLLCQQCDSRLHKKLSPHKKLIIGSFTGCPSANHFAALWGFDVNELHNFSSVESAASVISSDSDLGSCSLQHKKLGNQQDRNHFLIMHQILDLKNLQLAEGDTSHTHINPLRHTGDYATSSSMNTSVMLDENLEQQQMEKELSCLTNELESLDNSNQVLKGERFPSPVSQLDHLSSSSVGDPFWQYKSPVDNNQFWSQNLQDLGMCQELGCFDDFNMPDVDATFLNFEDLLTGDPDLTRALFEDHDPLLSYVEKASKNKFENLLIEATQEANPVSHAAQGLSTSVENLPHLVRFSRSATFSGSRLSAESSGSDFVDSGNSGYFVRAKSSNSVAELHGIEAEGGESSKRISKEKKNSRMHGKNTQLAPRKAKADMHKKIKSRCAKVQGYESDPANATKSH